MKSVQSLNSLSAVFDLNNDTIKQYLSFVNMHKMSDSYSVDQECGTAMHHIIPSCWFRQKNLDIDNSDQNMVRLLHKDHCFAHFLLAKYYIERDDKSERMMLIGMCNAVNRMMKQKSSTCPINQLSFNEILKFLDEYQNIMTAYRKSWKNLIRITDGKIDKLIDKNDQIPDGWHRGRSISGKRIKITDGIHVKCISKDQAIPPGWKRGTIAKPCKDRIWINNGKVNRRIHVSEHIPEGWNKGQLSSKHFVSDNFKFSSKNKKLITDGTHCKYISKNDFLPNGWHYGQADHDLGKIPHNLDKIWITDGNMNMYVNKK